MKFNIEVLNPHNVIDNEKMVLCMYLKQKLNSFNINEFDLITDLFINGGLRKIILDMEELQFIDSPAIGTIINTTKKIRKLKGDIIVTRYSSNILKIVEPVKLNKFIKFFPTLEAGLTHLKTMR
ncbi:STAS domain-containing protein [Spirochaetota bacterium]